MSWSWFDTEYSIRRVQHPLSTASSQDWLSSLHYHDQKLTAECSCSFRRASLHNRPPSVSSPWALNSKVTLSRSHGHELTNWRIESQHPAHHPWTASQSRSKLTRSWAPNTLDHSLPVNVPTRTITASKFPRSWPPSSYLHRCSITASNWTSNFARFQPPRSHDHGLQVHVDPRLITASYCISKLAWT